jgi:hypothetical protein
LLDFFVDFSVFGGASTARALVVRRDAALRAARWILGRTGAPLMAEDIDETAEDILGGGSAVPNAPPIPTNLLVSNDGSSPRKGKTCTAKNRDSDASRPCKMGGTKSQNNSRAFGL